MSKAAAVKSSLFGNVGEEDDAYDKRREKMHENIKHHGQCVTSQKRKKSKSPIKKDIKVSFDNQHESLLVLKDENTHLKRKQALLEDEVK